MKPAFDPQQRRALERAVASNAPPLCPACGAAVVVTPVQASPQVSYVRRRVLLVCPSCHRTAAVDVDSANRRDV